MLIKSKPLRENAERGMLIKRTPEGKCGTRNIGEKQHSAIRNPHSPMLICHLFSARRSPNLGPFSPSRGDSDKNFIQMFDFFTIFARQIIPSLGTPYDALH